MEATLRVALLITATLYSKRRKQRRNNLHCCGGGEDGGGHGGELGGNGVAGCRNPC